MTLTSLAMHEFITRVPLMESIKHMLVGLRQLVPGFSDARV